MEYKLIGHGAEAKIYLIESNKKEIINIYLNLIKIF